MPGGIVRSRPKAEMLVGGVRRDGAAVAAHRVGRPVEDGGLGGVLPREGPVPVGLGTLVAALVPQGLLVEPDELAVEGEKQTL